MNNFLRDSILLICVLFAAVGAYGEEVWINGAVMNAESGRRIYGGKISIIDAKTHKTLSEKIDNAPPQSVILSDGDSQFNIGFWCNDSARISLRVDLDKFKPASVIRSFPHDFDGTFRVDTLWVVPVECAETAEQLIKLREVTVTATKIKMVMNGDTIVYNADAFNLSTGSMLDALISQLPGVELNGNGQIKVNGKSVSSLFVDGKEFFNGDPNVALRNLPAYTVKNVQVYHHDYSEGLDRTIAQSDKEDLPLVMDVRLKPQYHKGFIGNLTAGYGVPDNRYLGRVFGMEYARNGRITGFLQTNNINNDASGPGIYDSEQWKNHSSSDGQKRIVKGGINFNWSRGSHKNKDKFDITGHVTYVRLKNHLLTGTSSEMFLPQGDNAFTGSNSTTSDLKNEVSSYFNWSVMSRPFTLYAQSGFSFNHDDDDYESTATQWGTRHEQLYQDRTAGDGWSRRYNAYTGLNFVLNTPQSMPLGHNIYFDWKLYHNKDNARTLRDINYTDNSSDIYLRQGVRNFARDLYFSPAYRLFVNICDFQHNDYSIGLRIIPRYTYQRQIGLRNIHVLDNPFQSMDEAVKDAVNSYYSDETSNIGALYAQLHYWKGQTIIDLILDGQMVHNHLIYNRGDINADISKLRWRWNPQFKSRWEIDGKGSKHKFRANAAVNRSLPSLVSLLQTTDNSNPLAIYLGNPNLKPSTTLMANVEYTNSNEPKKRTISFSVGHNYYWDRRSQYRSYDPATGASTYRPVNVSGAYTVDLGLDITAKLDRDNRWYIHSSTSASYEHIPDWISLNNADAVMSNVNNIVVSEKLKADWTINENYTLTAGINVSWRNAVSPLSNFQTINTVDLAPKLAAIAKLPLGLDFGSDFSIYKRFGYFDNSLNTIDYIWNASLQRPFLSGKIVARIEAYDILGQISNVSAVINSLGRTETRTNSLRRYVMLTVSYRFNIMPRKRG